jgi:hypothetical protein
LTSRISIRYWAVITLAAASALAFALTHSGTAKSADATQTALGNLAAFRRAARPNDQLPSSTATIPAGLVRRVGDTKGAEVWASVDNTNVCVQLAGGASACIPTTKFGDAPLVVGASNAGPGATVGEPRPEELAGVVPDDIVSVTITLKDGSATTTPIVDNGFYADTKGPVASVSWTASDGTVHSEASRASAHDGAEEER